MAIVNPLILLLAGFSQALPSSKLFERQQSQPAILNVPQSEWDALSSSVGGRLNDARPKNLACFGTYNNGSKEFADTYDSNQCTQIQQNRNNPDYIADQFGGYQVSNFASCMSTGLSCNMFNMQNDPGAAQRTCYQGNVPVRYIDVQEVGDIQAGLEFASKHKIPLVIKNTGHDYKGRSAGQHSLALWMKNLRPAIQVDDEFTPDGCGESAGPAVTYGGGERFKNIIAAAHDRGLVMVSGAAGSVGASGGWITGGGHGAITNTHGLGVDNALQMKAVLPNGTYITANRCQNQDLFFALRGGGGSTFGVVTETTSKLFPEFPIQFANIFVDASRAGDFYNVMVENAEAWAADGWGGYTGLAGDRKLLSAVSTRMNSTDAARASLKPLVDLAQASGSQNIDFFSLNSIWDYVANADQSLLNLVGNGVSLVGSSRLIPREQFQGSDNQQQLADILNSEAYVVQMVAPASYELPEEDQEGGPGEASVGPGWRNSLWTANLNRDWDGGNEADSTPSAVADKFRFINEAIQPLRDFTPDGGAYINEADPFEPDPIQTFWGQKNYDRLLKIKQEIDPDNILTCHQCVGWDPEDERYSCYPDI